MAHSHVYAYNQYSDSWSEHQCIALRSAKRLIQIRCYFQILFQYCTTVCAALLQAPSCVDHRMLSPHIYMPPIQHATIVTHIRDDMACVCTYTAVHAHSVCRHACDSWAIQTRTVATTSPRTTTGQALQWCCSPKPCRSI